MITRGRVCCLPSRLETSCPAGAQAPAPGEGRWPAIRGPRGMLRRLRRICGGTPANSARRLRRLSTRLEPLPRSGVHLLGASGAGPPRARRRGGGAVIPPARSLRRRRAALPPSSGAISPPRSTLSSRLPASSNASAAAGRSSIWSSSRCSRPISPRAGSTTRAGCRAPGAAVRAAFRSPGWRRRTEGHRPRRDAAAARPLPPPLVSPGLPLRPERCGAPPARAARRRSARSGAAPARALRRRLPRASATAS